MSENGKEKKQKIKKYEVSKPSYLIPFNGEKFFKIYKKSSTPTKRTNSADIKNRNFNKIKVEKKINSNRPKMFFQGKYSKKKEILNIFTKKKVDYTTISQSTSNIKNLNKIKNQNSPKKKNLMNSPILNKTNSKMNLNNNTINTNNNTLKESKILFNEIEENNINELINKKIFYNVKIQNIKKKSNSNHKTLMKQLQENQINTKINDLKNSSEKNLDLNKSLNSKNSDISFNKNSRKSTPIKNKNNSIQNKIKNHKIKNNTYREINTSPFIKNKRPKENTFLNNHILNFDKNKNSKSLTSSIDSSKSNLKNKTNFEIKNQIHSLNSLNKKNLKNNNNNEKNNPNINNNSSNNINIINNNEKKIHNEISQKQKNESDNKNNNNKINVSPKPKIIKTITQLDTLCKKGFSGPGLKKTNQDNFFVFPNFLNTSSIYVGVCDGHGLYGHLVSSYLISTLPQQVNIALQKDSLTINSPLNNMKETIIKTFKKINNDLITTSQIDTTFSGSTCVTLLVTPSRLLCANTGDSRAVLGSYINDNWCYRDLSRDHKPSEENEMKRIISSGGRIQPYKDENNNPIGPERVWLLDDDVPGLAMSRSFGDEIAHNVGVICVPEVGTFDLKEEDKFFVVASDGLWEFISSEECVKVIGSFYDKGDLSGAINFLYRESSKRWIIEEEVIDDITIVIGFFD